MLNDKKENKENNKKITSEEMLNSFYLILENLKINNKMNKLVNTNQIKKVKKEIARLLTKKNNLIKEK